MISTLTGHIVDWDERGGAIVVDVAGVGYTVSVHVRDKNDLFKHQQETNGAQVVLFVRSIAREDGTRLYGFVERSERDVFDRVCAVENCGPSTAMRLLGAMRGLDLDDAVRRKDKSALKGVGGVGPKTVDKLIEQMSVSVD